MLIIAGFAAVVPDKSKVFKAFESCSCKNCKIIMLLKDPYPQKGVATGLALANNEDVNERDLSPSLKVIKHSLIGDRNNLVDFDNTLNYWAEQGVLLLNSALTTRVGNIGSHIMIWRPFISDFLERLSHNTSGLIYVLFGKQAQSFEPYIDGKMNTILKENHPAYYARLNEDMPIDIFDNINKILYNANGVHINWYKDDA